MREGPREVRRLWDGGDIALIWRLSWPTLLYSILQSLVGMVDVFMVGRLGPASISAVGFSQQIMMVIGIASLAVSTGAMTMVAQSVGAGDAARARNVVRQSVLSALFVGGAMAVIGLSAAGPLLHALGAQPEVASLALPYLRLLFIVLVLMLPNFVIASIFRGSGDMVTPLRIAAVANIVNVAGNYAFIFGPGPFPALGVTGAACGTAAGRAVSLLWAVRLLAHGNGVVQLRLREVPIIDLKMMRQVLSIGAPAAAQGMLRNGARVLFFRMVATTAAATTAAAALTIGFQLRMFAIWPALAFGNAATTLVGQSLGAGQTKEARRLASRTLVLAGVIMAAVNAGVWASARALVAAFANDIHVVAIGAPMMRYFAVAQFLSCLCIVLGGILTGGGDTRPPMVYTVVSQWLVLLPVTALLMRAHEPLAGAWIAWTAAPAVQLMLMSGRYSSGKWQKML